MSRNKFSECQKCCGSGRHLYGSTAVWRGGIGGCMMTEGLCDDCWGSGDAERPFTDQREQEMKLQAAMEALKRIADNAPDGKEQQLAEQTLLNIRKIGR